MCKVQRCKGATATMSQIGEAAASEVSARSLFLEQVCKVQRSKGATATMSKIGEAAAASEVSARGVFLEQVCKVQQPWLKLVRYPRRAS